MNVLYLTMNPNRVSTTVPTEGWFRCLNEKGLRPVLVSSECGDFHRWCADQGIPVYQNDLPFPDKYHPVNFLRSLWKLRAIVKRHKIELIHCNEQDIYPIGQFLSRFCQIPVVVSVHFTLPNDFARWAFADKKQPNRMFFVSGRNMEECRPALVNVVPEDIRSVLHNGLNLERYQPSDELRQAFRTEYGIGKDDILLGVACALRPRKQLEHFFEMVHRLRQQNENIKVAVAGGPVPERKEYAQEIIGLGRELLGEEFIPVGHLDDLRPFCNGLDLFINTSREESFGIAPLEAMACGCPVIGYDSKAVDEVVLPDGGIIVEQDNIDELIKAVEQWISRPDQRVQERASARTQSLRFDIKAISDQLWTEYQSIIERPTASRAKELQHA